MTDWGRISTSTALMKKIGNHNRGFMRDTKIKNKRLIGLFLLGILLFNYPIVSIFNLNKTLFGFPLLYLYMFSVWGILILLIIINTEKNPRKRQINTPKPKG